jgi:hypothetical protein
MKRRDFIFQSSITGSGLLVLSSFPGCVNSQKPVSWVKSGKLFSSVNCDGNPLLSDNQLLDVSLRLSNDATEGAINLGTTSPTFQNRLFKGELTHKLINSNNGNGEDLLQATLSVTNLSGGPLHLDAEFITSAQPSKETGKQRIYIPLSAAALSRDPRFSALGVNNFLKDNDHEVGAAAFKCHYLEPLASFAGESETTALILAPVVDINYPGNKWRVALFTPSDEPTRFSGNDGVWRAGRQVVVSAGQTVSLRCWLMVHTGNSLIPWNAFHNFAHKDEYEVPDWVYDMKVHYFDFLSSDKGDGFPRGNGYESDVAHFKEFSVGMGTQHGYYPALGNYMNPDWHNWKAMRSDKAGAADMSIEKMKARIKATRETGAKAAIYMHANCFDEAADNFQEIKDCLLLDKTGNPIRYGWAGPDTAGTTWRASLASELWQNSLLQQAQWIMEILAPDAIVIDETFMGISYDYHPDRPNVVSGGAIDFFKKMRALVKAFGNDKAFFASDCSMSPFVLWADGEGGDHTYPNLSGHPLYVQEPVRYLAALGKKPWQPCAWNFQRLWDSQIKLAKQVGSGVGVSNGWKEYTGLSRLPADVRERMLKDIKDLIVK